MILNISIILFLTWSGEWPPSLLEAFSFAFAFALASGVILITWTGFAILIIRYSMYTVQCASNNNEHECCKLFEYASSLIQFLYLLYLHVLHRHTPHCLALRALHDLVKSGNHISFAPLHTRHKTIGVRVAPCQVEQLLLHTQASLPIRSDWPAQFCCTFMTTW